jgi:hypothetical protein
MVSKKGIEQVLYQGLFQDRDTPEDADALIASNEWSQAIDLTIFKKELTSLAKLLVYHPEIGLDLQGENDEVIVTLEWVWQEKKLASVRLQMPMYSSFKKWAGSL